MSKLVKGKSGKSGTRPALVDEPRWTIECAHFRKQWSRGSQPTYWVELYRNERDSVIAVQRRWRWVKKPDMEVVEGAVAISTKQTEDEINDTYMRAIWYALDHEYVLTHVE